MSNNTGNYDDVDRLLNGLFDPFMGKKKSLLELFEDKLVEANMSERAVRDILEVEYRPLKTVLEGSKTTVDFLILKKLSIFLNISESDVIKLFLDALSSHFKENIETTNIRKFIIDNFDLVSLKSAGIIDSISDFNSIEFSLREHFGYESIFEYGKNNKSVALSEGNRNVNHQKSNKFFIESSSEILCRINNYFDYDRQELVRYFPQIRWHTMNETHGLQQVVRDLFKIGITVIFRPYIKGLNIRGAAFAVNHKPCIILTNYTDFYPSIWFALIHELHHVLFDWDDIYMNSYQVSRLDDMFSPEEVEADNFAKEYLFSSEKMDHVRLKMNDYKFISKYATTNHVHPSVPYAFYCRERELVDKKVWAKYTKFIPSVKTAIESLKPIPWQDKKSVKEIVKSYSENLFNNV